MRFGPGPAIIVLIAISVASVSPAHGSAEEVVHPIRQKGFVNTWPVAVVTAVSRMSAG
jgi:hypothetical protein